MRRREGNYLSTEHVLLEIGGNKDGTAVRILASLGVSPETLENRPYSYTSNGLVVDA